MFERITSSTVIPLRRDIKEVEFVSIGHRLVCDIQNSANKIAEQKASEVYYVAMNRVIRKRRERLEPIDEPVAESVAKTRKQFHRYSYSALLCQLSSQKTLCVKQLFIAFGDNCCEYRKCWDSKCTPSVSSVIIIGESNTTIVWITLFPQTLREISF